MAEPKALGHDELYEKYKVYTPHRLRQRCEHAIATGYVIKDVIPQQSLCLVVGDSGLGKSPLLYQAGMCVAAGVDFLGLPVRQGRVLYVDAENGVLQVQDIQNRLAQHLGLGEAPAELLSLNLNDCCEQFGQDGHRLADVLRDVRPTLVVLDPIYALYRDIEKDAGAATKAYQELRELMRELACSVIGVHHLKKAGESSADLDDCPNPRKWFQQARGSSAMINGCDVRIGVDRPKARDQSCALIVRGFARVRGELPRLLLGRELDGNDEPLGYRRLFGVQLLGAADQAAYAKLGDDFRFTEAQAAFGKGAGATVGFLQGCIAVGVLEKLPGRDGYRKIDTQAPKPPPATEEPVAGVDGVAA